MRREKNRRRTAFKIVSDVQAFKTMSASICTTHYLIIFAARFGEGVLAPGTGVEKV
jgi:hypothetical protein